MKTLKQFVAEARIDPTIQNMLLTGGKGLHKAWWDKIHEVDPGAEPLHNNKVKWIKDWKCADVTVNGMNSNREQFFMEIMLMPEENDDGDIIGTRIYIHDANLPKDWQKTGIYSAGLKWLADHKKELKLTMRLAVHVSTNDAAWDALTKKFGFEWTNK